MSQVHVKGRHDRDPLREPTPEELADRLQRDGLKCEGISLLQTEYLERMQSAPEMIFCDPLPAEAWRQIADRIQRERRKFAMDSKVYEDATIALATARIVEHGTSLWDALVIQKECCETQYGESRREAQFILRHNGYKVSESYAGRNVG